MLWDQPQLVFQVSLIQHSMLAPIIVCAWQISRKKFFTLEQIGVWSKHTCRVSMQGCFPESRIPGLLSAK